MRKKFKALFLRILFNFTECSLIRKSLRILLPLINPRYDILLKVNGHKLHTNTLDRILALLLVKLRIYGKDELSIIKKYIKKGMVVCDVGANIGLFTLELARVVGNKGKVIAFEPDSSNFTLLKKNIKTNGYQNVELVQKAVSNSSGAVQLYYDKAHHGGHCIYNPHDGRYCTEVEAISLDDYFRYLDHKIDFIKIDVEGAECLVFSGMKELVKHNPGVIVLAEYSPHLLNKACFSARSFLDHVSRLEFSIFSVSDERPITDDDIIYDSSYTNLLLKNRKTK